MFAKILLTIIYPIARIIFPMKIIGKENIPKKGGFILCSNHTSLLDPVFFLLVCPRKVYFMAKDELFGSKIGAWFWKKFGVFSIKRGKGDIESINNAIKIIKDGEVMGIFPEGRRSRDYTPQNAKAGVALIANTAKCDVLPACVYAKGRIKPFKRTTIRFGEVMPFDTLGLAEGGKSEFKAASVKIMDEIKRLWGMGHENTAR